MRRYCCPRTYFYPRPPRGGRPGIRPALSALRYFYPRPPRGGRPLYGAARQGVRGISIHALREEGDGVARAVRAVIVDISIHALREEGDRRGPYPCNSARYFYPRPPRGGRPYFLESSVCSQAFLSTPSARRATYVDLSLTSWHFISIHALREEGDAALQLPVNSRNIFLSTPSARRATE